MKSNRKWRQRRKKLILKLLRQIMKGEFDNTPVLLDKLYDNKLPRQEYVSPRDRSTSNYGYMEIKEIPAGSPNTWS